MPRLRHRLVAVATASALAIGASLIAVGAHAAPLAQAPLAAAPSTAASSLIEAFNQTGGAYGSYRVATRGCTTLTAWYVATHTPYRYGHGDGGLVVAQLGAANPGLTITSVPTPGAVFSTYDSAWHASAGGPGHTGIVVGVEGNRVEIVHTYDDLAFDADPAYARSDTVIWNPTQNVTFALVGGTAGSPPTPWALIALSNDNVPGAAAFAEFRFGNPGDQVVRGDWNGDGAQTVGVFRQGHWYLNNSNDNSMPEIDFGFGNPGDVPIVGDWNGDGVDTVGVWRSGYWYLRETNEPASSFITIHWGNGTGDKPIVGDWDGNGTDTPGIVRTTSMGNEWIINNTLSDRTALSVRYGNPGDAVTVGDWDGNGTDTPAVVRGNTWYLNNGLDGVADRQADFGNPGDMPFPGDWDGAGGDGFGILRF